MVPGTNPGFNCVIDIICIINIIMIIIQGTFIICIITGVWLMPSARVSTFLGNLF